MVGNRTIDRSDPLGLREVDGYLILGTGHHLIPVELWKLLGFAPEVFPTLDSSTIGASGHNNLGHGKSTSYTGHIREFIEKELDCYLNSNKIKDGKLTLEQQTEFLEQAISKTTPVGQDRILPVSIKQQGKAMKNYSNGLKNLAENFLNQNHLEESPS